LSGASGAGTASGGDQAVDRWIVRLTPAAAARLDSVSRAESLLDPLAADFQIVRGLGLPGQLLVQAFASHDIARAALAANPHVAYFEPDSVVYAQRTPDDPFFSNMTNLHNVGQFCSTAGADIDAPEAWAMNTGSPGVVVGVIDSGVDLAHPDLYLNVWINQGEIRPDMREQLVDIDGDGLITFYDLNDPANAALVTDHNGNGYIDALDLLQNPRWADGRDTNCDGRY
jgi:subtilisin family serine protease